MSLTVLGSSHFVHNFCGKVGYCVTGFHRWYSGGCLQPIYWSIRQEYRWTQPEMGDTIEYGEVIQESRGAMVRFVAEPDLWLVKLHHMCQCVHCVDFIFGNAHQLHNRDDMLILFLVPVRWSFQLQYLSLFACLHAVDNGNVKFHKMHWTGLRGRGGISVKNMHLIGNNM